MSKIQALKAKCNAIDGKPIIDIDDFFDGNEDAGSIGCNLDMHPGIGVFRDILCGLKKENGVKEVLALVTEIDPGEDSWPFADTVYIFGDIDIGVVKARLAPLEPTEVDRIGFFASSELKNMAKAKNTKLTVAWWD
jgi:hypothetical protein